MNEHCTVGCTIEARKEFVGSGPNGKILPLDVYKHFKYTEVWLDTFRYEDDGFPSGEYMTNSGDGVKTIDRMLQTLDQLRKDRKIRLVLDYDPDFPIAMVRFWGTYLPEIQAKKKG